MVICFTYFHPRLYSVYYSILKLIFCSLDTISYEGLTCKLTTSLQLTLTTIPVTAVLDLLLLKNAFYQNAI